MTPLPYDNLAEIYDSWISTGGPELGELCRFYAERYLAAQGPVVECGVGNGRILIEAALGGRNVIGVDSSAAMLELCRRKAREAGVEDRLTLLQADFRQFQLAEKAALIAVPYDSIGHLVSAEERAAFFRHAFTQLAGGGELIFDQAVHDVDVAARHDGQPRLRARFADPRTGEELMLWYTSHQDVARRRREAVVYVTGGEGMRIVGRIENSWVSDAAEMSAPMAECGFVVAPVMGDFRGGPVGPASEYRIWVGHKPIAR